MTDVSLRWVVYATFDASGRKRSHALDQVRAYRELGFEVLVVDSSPTPSDERIRGWEDAAAGWLARANEGYDFGAYGAGLDALASRGVPPEGTTLLLANDSCFGPYAPLAAVIERFDREEPGRPIVYGITDSLEQRRHHLQSYWLYFRPNVVPHARAFFAAERPTARDRDEAIWFGELSFSAFLQARGCELRAWCDVRRTLAHYARYRARVPALVELLVRLASGRPKYGRRADIACVLALLGHPRAPSVLHNQTLAFGLRMVAEGATPFVKQALLRDNQLADPMVPPGIDVAALDNASAAALVDDLLARARAGPRLRTPLARRARP